MINVFYEDLPDCVTIKGREYPVITSFKEWIKWLDMIADKDLSTAEKLYLTNEMFLCESCDFVQVSLKEQIEAIIDFLALRSESANTAGNTAQQSHNQRLLSYTYDSKYIIPDFLRYYGIDLLKEDLHWWKFRMLLDGLPEEAMTKKVIYYRGVDLSTIKDDKERARIMRIKQNLKLPDEGVATDAEIASSFF